MKLTVKTGGVGVHIVDENNAGIAVMCSSKEDKANLLAAAPELLEALKDVELNYARVHSFGLLSEKEVQLWEQVKAAITKATNAH